MPEKIPPVVTAIGYAARIWKTRMVMCSRTHVNFPIAYEATASRSGKVWKWKAEALGRNDIIISSGESATRNGALSLATAAVVAELECPSTSTSDAA